MMYKPALKGDGAARRNAQQDESQLAYRGIRDDPLEIVRAQAAPALTMALTAAIVGTMTVNFFVDGKRRGKKPRIGIYADLHQHRRVQQRVTGEGATPASGQPAPSSGKVADFERMPARIVQTISPGAARP